MPANVESMAYYGEVPWHGFGEPVDEPLTGEEMLVRSGTAWEVELADLEAVYSVKDADGEVKRRWLDVPTHRAVIRRRPVEGFDDILILGVVGDRYTPIQNSEAVDFAESLIGTGQAVYHTGGSLKDGKRVWYLLKAETNGFHLPGDEEVEQYLLVTTSHDGNSSLTCAITPVRVVCSNTLNLALKSTKQSFKVRHMSGYKAKAEAARDALGLTSVYFKRLEEQALALASQQMSAEDVTAFLNRLCPVVNEAPLATRYQEQITRLFEGEGLGLNHPAIKGSRWAMLNASVEWIDRVRPARVTGVKDPSDQQIAEARLNSLWFGSGRDLKQKAYALLAQPA
jgi:phage/plasmid-like protein (TIGR03299 family)